MKSSWQLINPLRILNKEQKETLKNFIKDLDSLDMEGLDHEESFVLLKKIEKEISDSQDLKLQSILMLVIDFVRVGWKVKQTQKGLFILKSEDEENLDLKKELFRKRYSFQRFNQLSQDSIRKFISNMERVKNINGKSVSVLSLMRDGEDLSEKLEKSLLSDNIKLIPEIIDPYIEPVGDISDKKICKHTGLKLSDIYRYFRYTWITPSHSVPGRSMKFLVRDAGAENHPIIGIYALSSAAPQLKKRDNSIGWSNEAILQRLKSSNSKLTIRLIIKQIEEMIQSIRVDDFFSEKIIKPQDLHVKNIESFENLEIKAKKWKRLWEKIPEKKAILNDPVLASETYLYKSKRASELSFLLRSKCAFNEVKDSKSKIQEFLDNKKNLTTLNGLIKRIRSKKLGINIADLTVCGSIPPYNKLIAGKLVSSLAVSPKTISLYKEKYKNTISVIASCMAGREISKDADLVYISTTSLFGVRPCQYDNINIPLSISDNHTEASIKYKYLGKLEGGGSMHFSRETTETLANYLRSESESRVNYIFGEGASPKLRAIRQAISRLGFIGEDLIYHGMPKTLYQVNLIKNLPNYLMGFDEKPYYFFNIKDNHLLTKEISKWWSERWAIKRLRRDKEKLLQAVAEDNFVNPISHGAKVIMPDTHQDQASFSLE